MGPKTRTVKFYSTVSDRSEVVHLIAKLFNADGGPGSGNHGHAGRPGKVGGSAPGGGGGGSEKKVKIKIDPENQKMVSASLHPQGGGSAKAKKNEVSKKMALKALHEQEKRINEIIAGNPDANNEIWLAAKRETLEKIRELDPDYVPYSEKNSGEAVRERARKLAIKFKKEEIERLEKANEKAGGIEIYDKTIAELKKQLAELENGPSPEPEKPKEESITALEDEKEKKQREKIELTRRMRLLNNEDISLSVKLSQELSDEERAETKARYAEVQKERNEIREQYRPLENEVDELESKIMDLEKREPLESIEKRLERKQDRQDELVDECDEYYSKMQDALNRYRLADMGDDQELAERLRKEHELAQAAWEDVRAIKNENDIKVEWLKELKKTRVAENERDEIEAAGITEADYRRDKALEHFGTTDDWHEAGWILPEGQLLNFSGEKDYHPGERGFDHREIGQVYPEFGSYDTEAMQRFRNDGNIRFYPEAPGVNVCSDVEPTPQQYDEIARIALDAIDEQGFFIVDFSTSDGDMFGSLRYAVDPSDAGIDGVQAFDDPYEVINDIKYYFETGEITEEFGTPHFMWDSKTISDGGPGSGNHGHAGRPGQVGGSAPGEGGGGNGSEGKKSDGESLYQILEKARARRDKASQRADELKKESEKWVEKILAAQKNGTLDKVMKEYKSFDVEYAKAKKEYSDAYDEAEKARKAYEAEYETNEKEKERKEIEKSGMSEADWRRNKAVQYYGYTEDFREAGYMLPNGKCLNFCGSKGQHYGMRGNDHRDIAGMYAAPSYGGSKEMVRFMSDGNIRVMAESPGVDISTAMEPTSEQYRQIERMADRFAREEYFSVDLTDENGRTVGNLEYNGRINPIKVSADIKNYFRTGKLPQESLVGQFHLDELSEPDRHVSEKEIREIVRSNPPVNRDGVARHVVGSPEFNAEKRRREQRGLPPQSEINPADLANIGKEIRRKMNSEEYTLSKKGNGEYRLMIRIDNSPQKAYNKNGKAIMTTMYCVPVSKRRGFHFYPIAEEDAT